MLANVVTFTLAALFIGIGVPMAISIDRSVPGRTQNRIKPVGTMLIAIGIIILLAWTYVMSGTT